MFLIPQRSAGRTSFEFDHVVYHTCYDGDTCMVSLPGIHPLFGDHIAIRIRGIDTPELKGRCEQEKALARTARDVIRGILEAAKKIRVINVSRGDKYFRLLAQIEADGVDLGVTLLERSLAVPYNGGTKTHDWCHPLK